MTTTDRPLRLAFMGSPDFSNGTLRALIAAGHDVVCVYAQPPRPAGRGQKERLCPVHAEAQAHDISVRTPKSLKDPDAQQAFRDLDLDVAIVVAYGLILPQAILDAPRLGCLNVHASILPRWRGAAPIQRAILAGDTETGVAIMKMDAGLDTGDVLAEAKTPISADETGQTLHDRLAMMGAELMVETLPDYAAGTLQPTPQVEDGVTYASKLEKHEGRLNFNDTCQELDRRVRAFSPWPGTYFEFDGQRVKVMSAEIDDTPPHAPPGTVLDDCLTIACANCTFRPTRIQRPGKGAMETDLCLRGFPIDPGTVLDPVV